MSLLDLLTDAEAWREFYLQRTEQGYLSARDERLLSDFLREARYEKIGRRIAAEGFYFSPKIKKLVNKQGSDKKRAVFCYPQDETLVLKFLARRLHKYDAYFSPNCLAFRKDFSVRRALGGLIGTVREGEYFCYKLDVQNYFNSIDISLLLPMLKELFSDDLALYNFFERMLERGGVGPDGDGEPWGVMAGTPTAPFFANVYLTGLDRHFYRLNAPYARYSDDVVVFAKSVEELSLYEEYIGAFLGSLRLRVNEKKVGHFAPYQPWAFLGVEYRGGETDLSTATLEKIKDKIRRKSRSLDRWRKLKGAPRDKAAKVLLREFNKKFFEDAGEGELTWCRWYFPLLTTDRGLCEVDGFLQAHARALITGRHVGTNAKTVPYVRLKELGFISLVNRFYKK
jgi:hypothetical protein